MTGTGVLIIDDRSSFKRQVEKHLAGGGYRLYTAESISNLLEIVVSKPISLVILRYTSPVDATREMIQSCKKKTKYKNLLFLCYSESLVSSSHMVEALDAGVDDYVVYPFNWKVFTARVKALARRAVFRSESHAWLAGKNIKVNLNSHAVTVNNKPVSLRPKEYGLICLFLEKPGVVLDRSYLMEQIWEYSYFGTTRTVDKHIENLRNKLGSAGKYIQTVERAGYKFE
ncbi:MAG: response regulator transcription factor [bacterium]